MKYTEALKKAIDGEKIRCTCGKRDWDKQDKFVYFDGVRFVYDSQGIAYIAESTLDEHMEHDWVIYHEEPKFKENDVVYNHDGDIGIIKEFYGFNSTGEVTYVVAFTKLVSRTIRESLLTKIELIKEGENS